MRFRLAPRSMTLDDLELKFYRNFALRRIFGGLYCIFGLKSFKGSPSLYASEIQLNVGAQ